MRRTLYTRGKLICIIDNNQLLKKTMSVDNLTETIDLCDSDEDSFAKSKEIITLDDTMDSINSSLGQGTSRISRRRYFDNNASSSSEFKLSENGTKDGDDIEVVAVQLAKPKPKPTKVRTFVLRRRSFGPSPRKNRDDLKPKLQSIKKKKVKRRRLADIQTSPFFKKRTPRKIVQRNSVQRNRKRLHRNATSTFESVPSVSQPENSCNQSQQPQRGQPFSFFGSNLYISQPPEAKAPGSLRTIVIDGSNVAMGHGNHSKFSCRGIKICCDYFVNRGHTVVAFVPRYRQKHSQSTDPQILDQLEKEGICKFTASREVNGLRIASYDDRYIVQFAAESDGVIVSNDNFKDLYKEQPRWRDTIRDRLLQYTWINENSLMFPPDPMGAGGPCLDDFLRF